MIAKLLAKVTPVKVVDVITVFEGLKNTTSHDFDTQQATNEQQTQH